MAPNVCLNWQDVILSVRVCHFNLVILRRLIFCYQWYLDALESEQQHTNKKPAFPTKTTKSETRADLIFTGNLASRKKIEKHLAYT